MLSYLKDNAKGLVAKLALPHVQSAWGSRGERIRAVGLAACYNYFSKKKKKKIMEKINGLFLIRTFIS